MEQWKQIEGYGYEVSSLGRVRNMATGRILTPMWTGRKAKQYATVTLSSKPLVNRKVHQLVLEAFVGPRPESYFGCHKDDDTTNNSVTNLFWGTPSANARTSHRETRLTAEQKIEVRQRRLNGEGGRALAREYGVSEQLICDVYHERTGWGTP